MRQKIRPFVVLWALVLVGGCASDDEATTAQSWPEPRLLGKEVPAFRAPTGPSADIRRARVSQAEPSGVLNLRQALSLALMRNPELAAFSWDVRATEARILQANLLPNPDIEAEVENFGGSNELRGLDGAETTIQLSQLIELGGKRSKRVRVAQLERDLAGWSYESKRLDVFTATSKAFIGVLQAQRQVALQQQLFMLARRVSATVRERVRAGRVSAVEETKARVELGTARIGRDRAARELQAARVRLTSTWGSTTPSFERAEGEFDKVDPPPPLAALSKQILDNPDIIGSRTELDLRRSSLDLERARRIPDVTLSAGVRRFEESDDSAFVASVSIPIPVFGINPGSRREAERRIPQGKELRRATELQVKSALEQAYGKLVALFEELTVLKRDVLPGAKSAFDAAELGFRQGKFGFLDVLDAQRTLFEARARYIETLGSYHVLKLDIERLIGRPIGTVGGGPR